jgi:hypothetical protein
VNVPYLLLIEIAYRNKVNGITCMTARDNEAWSSAMFFAPLIGALTYCPQVWNGALLLCDFVLARRGMPHRASPLPCLGKNWLLRTATSTVRVASGPLTPPELFEDTPVCELGSGVGLVWLIS